MDRPTEAIAWNAIGMHARNGAHQPLFLIIMIRWMGAYGSWSCKRELGFGNACMPWFPETIPNGNIEVGGLKHYSHVG